MHCIFCVVFVLQTVVILDAEYVIKPRPVPSYLEIKFESVSENIFPKKIVVDMQLTKISGNLLKAIDKYNNEVLLQFTNKSGLLLKINKFQDDIPLKDLCGCDVCVSVRMKIFMQITNTVHLSCNSLRRIIRNFDKDQSNKIIRKSPSDATLWFVNTPQKDAVEQMEGRIFSIKYNDNQIKPKIFGTAITDLDVIACVADVCNGGICHETHRDAPLCDCTKTFGSGWNCIDESRVVNKRYSQQFQFSSIKLSWRSDSSNIFRIENKETYLEVREEKDRLLLIRKSVKETLDILTNDYRKNEIYILTIDFDDKLKIQLTNVSSIEKSSPIDIRNEVFKNLTLSSGTGVMDIAYKKNVSDITWKKWNLNEATSETIPPLTTTTPKMKHQTTILGTETRKTVKSRIAEVKSEGPWSSKMISTKSYKYADTTKLVKEYENKTAFLNSEDIPLNTFGRMKKLFTDANPVLIAILVIVSLFLLLVMIIAIIKLCNVRENPRTENYPIILDNILTPPPNGNETRNHGEYGSVADGMNEYEDIDAVPVLNDGEQPGPSTSGGNCSLEGYVVMRKPDETESNKAVIISACEKNDNPYITVRA